ncbi:hypothetical protein K8I28_17510 [bacterium]|nr:hypothetical protein [bacterium]
MRQFILFLLMLIVYSSISFCNFDYNYGYLPITSFTTDDYDGDGQCFDIAITSDNLIFVANSSGILLYDGHSWTTISGTEGMIFLSVAVDTEDRVWVGSREGAGIITKQANGEYYYSAINTSSEEYPDIISSVYRIETTPQGIYFQSPSLLVRYTIQADQSPFDGKITQWKAEGHFFQMSLSVGNRMLLGRHKLQLQEVIGDSLLPFPGAAETAELTLVHAIQFDENQILLTNYKGSLHLLDENGLYLFNSEVNRFIHGTFVYGVCKVAPDYFALSSLQNGLILFDKQGRIIDVLDREMGLPSTVVNRTAVTDATGGIWAPLDFGVTRISTNPPLRYFDNRNNLSSSIIDVTWINDRLYAATPTGVFVLNRQQANSFRPPVFTIVEEIQHAAWEFVKTENYTCVNTLKGLYAIDKSGKAQRIEGMSGNVLATAVSSDQNYIYLSAEQRGLHLYSQKNNKVTYETKLDAPADLIPNIIIHNGDLWIQAAEKGELTLFRSTLDPGKAQSLNFTAYGEDKGILSPIGENNFVIWHDYLFLGTRDGLLGYSEAEDKFLPASEILNISNELPNHLSSVGLDEQGRLYAVTKPYTLARYDLNSQGKLVVDHPVDGVRIRRILGMEYNADNGFMALGTDDGRVLLYNSAADTVRRKINRSMISAIVLNQDSTVAAWLDATSTPELTLNWPVDNLRIEYTLPSYDAVDQNNFRYRLIGSSSDWSEWSNESYHDFSNLMEGDYCFEVESRDAYGNISEAAIVNFKVLPPWYRTIWAWFLWVLLITGLIYTLIKLRSNRLEREKKHLSEQVSAKTAELLVAQKAELELVDARRKAEFEAQKLSTISQLSRAVAHEFNNPLAIMQGNLFLAQQNLENTEKLKSFIKSTEEQVMRMKDLVSKMEKLDKIQEVDYAAGIKMLNLHPMETKNPEENQKNQP